METSKEASPRPEAEAREAPRPLELRFGADWRLSADIFVQDKPGQLFEVAALIAARGGNIELFSFNRSEDCHKIGIVVSSPQASALGHLADDLQAGGWLAAPQVKTKPLASLAAPFDRDLQPGGLLGIKIRLDNKPGALAGFARILRDRGANVMYLSYGVDTPLEMAEMTMATASSEEVTGLLDQLSNEDYQFHVAWRGAHGSGMNTAIGLNAVEAFLFQLRALLPPDKLNSLRELLRSSEELRSAMADFQREAGENSGALAVSEILGHILHLAAASLGKTGKRFAMRLTGPLNLTERVALYSIACPTGANAYLLRSPEGRATLVDSSYGLYYEDAMTWLAGHGLNPAQITELLLTHADADHAGWVARLEEQYGTRVYAHPGSRVVFDEENRLAGGDSPLLTMNGAYTRLINRITDLRIPRTILPFAAPGPDAPERLGAFPVLGAHRFEDVELLVLESLGGHIPGQVFFFAPEQGALFCGDFLIDVSSLSDRTKNTLSLPRYLLTSTNGDSRLFSREMKALRELMLETQRRLAQSGGTARVFPGHGDFYAMEEVE